MGQGTGKGPGRVPGLRRPGVLWGLGSLLGLALLALVLSLGGTEAVPERRAGAPAGEEPSPATALPAAPPVEEAPVLELAGSDWSWERRGDSAVVAGRVRNVSGAPLRTVVAEVSFFDGAGRFLASREALVARSPIPPGQTAPFEVVGPWDPAVREARVGFQDVMGVPLPTRRRP